MLLFAQVPGRQFPVQFREFVTVQARILVIAVRAQRRMSAHERRQQEQKRRANQQSGDDPENRHFWCSAPPASNACARARCSALNSPCASALRRRLR